MSCSISALSVVSASGKWKPVISAWSNGTTKANLQASEKTGREWSNYTGSGWLTARFHPLS
jgi:hypothetical protein